MPQPFDIVVLGPESLMKYLILSLCFILGSTGLWAKQTYHIPRTQIQPVIDANLDEAIWSYAKKVKLAYNTSPQDSTPAEVETTAMMIEDGEYLYVAFIAKDPNPEEIRAYYRNRDGIFQDDFVGIILDTFNDEQRGYEFFVNPLGSQGDLTIDDTTGGNNNEDSNWDTVWDSAGTITETGYQVEMAIPLRNLRHPSDLAEQTWGIEFLRIYPRDSRNAFTASPRNRELTCTLCQINKLKGFPNLKSETTNLEFTPTLTYVNAEEREIEPIEDWQSDSDKVDFGLDMRWAMTEDWIMNATINPDFSQVEVDGAQLDINNTFSLFFPEKRPFFLEGADYFNSMGRLIHTRNISDPDYGLKVTGKSNGYTAGVIATRDTSTNILIPSNESSYVETLELESDVLIARVQHNIGDQNNFGALVTHRSAEGYQNTIASIDSRYYLTDNDVIRAQYTHSSSENPDSIRFDEGDELFAANQEDYALRLNYRHIQENYRIFGFYNDVGKDFRADMGFVGQVDYKKMVFGGRYIWFGEEGSSWTRSSLRADVDRTESQDGQLLEQEFDVHYDIQGPMQFDAAAAFTTKDKFYDGEMFQLDIYRVRVEFNPLSNLRIFAFMRYGDSIDYSNTQLGTGGSIGTNIDWLVGKHFSVNINRRNTFLDLPMGKLFDAVLYDVRVAYQFDQRSRLSLTVQSTNITRDTSLYDDNYDTDPDNDVTAIYNNLSTQLLYSYKMNPKTLFFLGYSDGGYENENIGSLQKTNRNIFAKFSYHWQI